MVLTPDFQYVLLDEVGSVIMAAIAEPADVDTIARTVCAEFDADLSQVAADLRHYLPTLVTAGLAVQS
jgi:hypothetical protein